MKFANHLMLAASLIISACGSTPPAPDLYLLSLDSNGVDASINSSGDVIGVAEISIPGYANTEKFAVQTAENRLALQNGAKWAEPLEKSLSTLVAQEIENLSKRPVISRPFPRGVDPTLQVNLRFERVLMGANSEAQLNGQIIIVDTSRRSASSKLRRFEIRVPAEQLGNSAYVDALEVAVRQLAAKIVTMLGVAS